jgi:histidinol-phosphate/aromatic aminotransferase/cobyric acid decarboxylase-like protein
MRAKPRTYQGEAFPVAGQPAGKLAVSINRHGAFVPSPPQVVKAWTQAIDHNQRYPRDAAIVLKATERFYGPRPANVDFS